MALTITVHGQGTFTASMEEGPVTFTASIGSVGPQGPQGETGVIAATSPLSYNSLTRTISADLSAYETLAHAAATYYPIPTGNTAQYIRGDGSIVNFPTVFTADKMTATVYNQTGSTLTKGQVVYINGAHGNLPTVALAQANGEATSAGTYGFIAADIGNNSSGTIVIAGVAENLNTNALADGDKLYLSPTVAGGYTTTKPAAPNHMVYLGVVTRAHPTLGTIQLRIANGFELSELHDCAVPTPADKDLLVYESSTSLWKNKSFSTLDLLTGTAAASTYYLASNPSGYITSSALSGYATQSWVTGQGYITSSALSPYLTSATASATYYPIPAGTTAQYLRGDGTASTFATDVNAAVLAATETVAGKVELATDAEAIAGGNTVTVMTPADVRRALLSHRYRPIPVIGWTATTSGTGASATQAVFYPSLSGPNAGVAGSARFTALIGSPSRGTSPSVFSWNKAMVTTVRLNKADVSDLAHILMFSFGKNVLSWPGDGDLTARGVAVKIVGSSITLQVHNGTTLTNVSASSNIGSGNACNDFLIYSNGSGTVELWHNDTIVATTASGPTGTSATNGFGLAAEVVSTASSTVRTVSTFVGCVSFWHDC